MNEQSTRKLWLDKTASLATLPEGSFQAEMVRQEAEILRKHYFWLTGCTMPGLRSLHNKISDCEIAINVMVEPDMKMYREDLYDEIEYYKTLLSRAESQF